MSEQPVNPHLAEYHVHHHINVILPPGTAFTPTLGEEFFRDVRIHGMSETETQENPDGTTSVIYKEAKIAAADVQAMAARFPQFTFVLLSHGHDATTEERTALVLQGESARFETVFKFTGDADDVIAEAMSVEDFRLGQPK